MAKAVVRLLGGLFVLAVAGSAWGAGADERDTPEKSVDLDLEYRFQMMYINPLELNGLVAREVGYAQHRLRLEPAFRPVVGVSLFAQVDVLDGVLAGDNGEYGGDPSAGSGLALTSRWPNNAGFKVGLLEGRDPLDPDSYGLTLTEVDPVKINRVWGEVMLPVGLLRIGRQPAASGPGIGLHDGSRTNRWGVSRYSATADRILFATKVSEVYRMIRDGAAYETDRAMDDGVFLVGAEDLAVEDDPSYGGDDLKQGVGMLQVRVKEPRLFGMDWHPFLFQVAVGGRFGEQFKTSVYSIPVSLEFGLGPLRFQGELVAIYGQTQEISQGMAALREADEAKRVIRDQTIQGMGARAILDVEMGPVTGTLEFDYAQGDSDPRDETPLTSFSFARDANVGLLLFEHVLAFETARSAAVGIQNLQHMGVSSFPLTEIASDGRVQNAIVFFPQLLVKPVSSLGIRGGVMFAWADAPVTDPIMTLLNEDGEQIADDAVNWHGGKPAKYYGTEFDLQVEWTFREHFIWTVEGAALLPGAALQDESGDAVPSFLLESRFTFLF